MLTDKQVESRIKKLVIIKNEIDESFDSLADVTGATVDSPLGEAIYSSLSLHLKTLSELIGDDFEWLAWFVWENDCGASGLEAGETGNLKPVRTAKDLTKLIRGENEKQT
ncbi:hypothetical protein [Pseudoalteromonas marina]|uniref:hypothetical protein n=1 Tax=Pseudoalteromonas marina TaxID=267375 RepID=UPI003C524F5B